MKIAYKQLKHQEQTRQFHFPTSVFGKFRKDTEASLEKACYLDISFCKISRFIKDPVELQNTKLVLSEYYPIIKDQF